jgi:anti-anti-sigma factor
VPTTIYEAFCSASVRVLQLLILIDDTSAGGLSGQLNDIRAFIRDNLPAEIGERRDGNITVLSPVGRIDNETSAAFQKKLLDSVGLEGAAVLIDFAAVDYISSAGLRALMMAAKQSKAGNRQLAVAALRPVVKEIFDISRFSLVVQVFDTPADALAALR